MAAYGELYAVLFVLVVCIDMANVGYKLYPINAPLIYSRQVEIEVYPPCLSCLSLAIILFSSFRFRLIGSTCRNRFIGFWLYTPFRVLKWCFCLPCFTLACLLIARVYYAQTLSHSVIMRYLHLAEEYPPAQLIQDRRAVLIVPCHLFDCRFFVE